MSKVISRDEGGGYLPWELPEMEGADEALQEGEFDTPAVEEEVASPVTAEQIEAIQRQARDEAYEQGQREGFEYGHREGLEAAQQQIEGEESRLAARIVQWERLMQSLERPFEELDEQVEEELIALSKALTRQMLRREMKNDPGQVVAVVREALGVLPSARRQVRVHLHPEDAEVVRRAFSLNEEEVSWQVCDDPALTRGGCRVVTETSQVDASLESRLATLFANAFGGERLQDGREE